VADAVALNAAAAIAAYVGLSGDLEADLAAGLERARLVLSSQASVALVERWVAVSQREAARVI
jgi:anthranilate phosphoribosyltransferase